MAKTNNNYAKIVAHAWKDARYKEKLLKNPKAALKEMGMDIPENLEVRVIEEKANSMTFVLPTAPAKARELSEQELQKMAGGTVLATPNRGRDAEGVGIIGSVKNQPWVMC